MKAKPTSIPRREFLKTSLVGAALGPTLLAGVSAGEARAEARVQAAPDAPSFPSEANAIYVSDLSTCQPVDALTRTFEEGRWQMVDYETEQGVKGVMVFARSEPHCSALTLPLRVNGRHRIFLGINYTKSEFGWQGAQLEVKLDDDPAFRSVRIEAGSVDTKGQPKIGVNRETFGSVQETYWRAADLTGRSLVFRQPDAYGRPGVEPQMSNLSYVKLVPLDEPGRRRFEESQPRPETRRLAQLYCTANMTAPTSGGPPFRPTQREWFEAEFTPYRDADFKMLVFEAMRGEFCLFPTKIGHIGRPDNQWPKEWIDPMEEMARLSRAHGMKIFASLRMIGRQYPMNTWPIAQAPHYRAHPEFAKKDRDGVPMSNLSLAYPAVRQFWLSLLREVLAYDLDGLQLHLDRSTPFVSYEEPVVKAFQEHYGEDPLRLPESDPRWQKHCAGYVTQFLREVRQLLDEKPGRELAVTIYGEPHKYDKEPGYHPIRYNCDVETWLTEKLVNYVMPTPRIDPALLRKWRALAGARAHLWPDLMPRTQPAEEYAKLAQKYYDAGADGFCLWDGEGRPSQISAWSAIVQLGHREQLAQLIAEAPSYYRRVPLKYLDGMSVKDSFHDG